MPVIGYPFLAALGFKNDANLSTVVGSIFHIIALLVLYLLGSIDIYNIVYLLIITESIVFLYRVIAVYRRKIFRFTR